jgi:PKD repeat protein
VSWAELNPVAAALDRATNEITATFRGRDALRPVADFHATRELDELLVEFMDESTSPTSTIASWAWDFGDGSTSTSQHPSHTYAAAGHYLVTLVVVDAAGRRDEYQEVIPVDVEEGTGVQVGPVAGFTHVASGLQVTFTDTSTMLSDDATIVGWEWNFGENPTADFTFVVNTLQVTFTDASTDFDGTIASRLYDFGDGTTSTSTNPVKNYTTGGTYNVTLTVTDDDGNTGTVSKIVAVTSGAIIGIPFGCFNLYTGTATIETAGTDDLNFDHSYVSPTNLVARINDARTRGISLVTTIPGSTHDPWITAGEFDLEKWKDGVDTFATAANIAAIQAALIDGTVVGNSMMDEPNHDSWGPDGVMTKAVLDEMAGYMHTKFPTTPGFPQGAVIVHWWREGTGNNATQPQETYQVLDFIIPQYDWWQSPNGPGGGQSGNYTGWRAAAQTAAARNGIKLAFSMNVRDGGIQDIFPPITWSCPTVGDPLLEATGGFGSQSPQCRYSATQLETWGKHFGEAGGFLMMWKYNTAFFSTGPFAAANTAAMAAVQAHLATKPRPSLLRNS